MASRWCRCPGRSRPPTGARTDALFVVARSCGQAPQTLRIVVPYRNAGSEQGFAVYPPGFVDWQGEGEPDLRAAGAAFFRGVQSHGEAAAVRADHFVDPA